MAPVPFRLPSGLSLVPFSAQISVLGSHVTLAGGPVSNFEIRPRYLLRSDWSSKLPVPGRQRRANVVFIAYGVWGRRSYWSAFSRGSGRAGGHLAANQRTGLRPLQDRWGIGEICCALRNDRGTAAWRRFSLLTVVIPSARLSFYRRVATLQKLVDEACSPRRLIQVLVYLWQAKRFPYLLPGRQPWGARQLATKPAVQNFVTWLDEQPFDEAAYWLATLHSRLVGAAVREDRAMFFTPPRLAERVIADLEKHGASVLEHKWHDPACGGSAFLIPLALRMKKELGKTKVPAKAQLKRIARSLCGNDIDRDLLDLSDALLKMALYPLIKEANFIPDFRLSNRDGLAAEETHGEQFDVIVCNPPYRKLRAEEVERYRSEYESIFQGQPNMYGLFIHKVTRLCRRGGWIGLLTPTSFLSGHSFSKLRRHLTEKVDILQFDMLSSRTSMFFDVMQETAISVLSVRANGRSPAPKVDVAVLSDSGKFKKVGNCRLPDNGDPWPIPRSVDDAKLLKLVEERKFGLSDYGYAAKVGHLVGYRDKRKRFADLSANPRKDIVVPLVWATDIAPTGKFEHGRDHKIKRDAAFVRVINLDDPGVVCQSAVLLQRLTSSDQRSRLIAASVPSSWVKTYGGFVCENHVIVLEPKGKPAVPVPTMAAILNTKVVDRIFRTISSASNVGVSELKKLLLPDPNVLVQRLASGESVETAVFSSYGRTKK